MHQLRLDQINHQNDVKHVKKIVDSGYLKMKKQLGKYKVRAGEFKQMERDNEVKQENLVLLNKMKEIQNGKQSAYGQHVLRRTSIDPPALNNYNKQLMKRPSSERPIESADDVRNDFKMTTTINNPSSDINADSVRSNDVSRAGIGTTPIQTSHFTHEALLLSMYGKTSKNGPGGTFFPKQRANSHFGQTMNLNDILSNQSLLQSNMSSSTMIDSSRPIKQKRSLNFHNKKREAERIDTENAVIM